MAKKKTKVGSRFNQDKLRWRNFPLFLLEPLIKVAHEGEKKYSAFNFLKGAYVNDCMDSMKRHMMKLESPFHSDNDEESGCSHAAHIAWNALVIAYVLTYRKELDDRWNPKNEKKK